MSCVAWCDFEGPLPPKTDSPINAAWEIDLSTFSNWFRNEVLGIFEGNAPTIPTNLYVAAHSTVCSAETPGTELSGDGYTRFQIMFVRVSDIKRWNGVDYMSSQASATWNVASLSLWDSASIGAGNYYAFGNLTETLEVSSGQSIVLQAERAIIGMGSAIT